MMRFLEDIVDSLVRGPTEITAEPDTGQESRSRAASAWSLNPAAPSLLRADKCQKQHCVQKIFSERLLEKLVPISKQLCGCRATCDTRAAAIGLETHNPRPEASIGTGSRSSPDSPVTREPRRWVWRLRMAWTRLVRTKTKQENITTITSWKILTKELK